MTESDLIKFLRDALEAEQVPYFLVGSLASSYYGEPRFTLDVDVAVWLGTEPARVVDICRHFLPPDFYVSLDAAQSAAAGGGQFNIIHPASSLKIDVMVLENSVYDRHRRSRTRRVTFPGVGELVVAAPEDIVIKKMVYYREGGSEKHLRDIASILRVQRDVMDREDIAAWAKTFGVGDVWEAICSKLDV